ncbi:3-mercaptopyruvate sulfurtransferase [Trichinella papuae]|uniref:3-mercaptopyruvate sulfurtransferase n=1 Tax=Trichinella papuae TaxID=268474 RepID=A0A0V1N8D6_9BILA|nr:3-mercaptopyruvate sulfurtransferase [Trichinella papuae]
MYNAKRENIVSTMNGPENRLYPLGQSAPSAAERSYYSFDTKRPKLGSCIWISIVLFILFILILIICLIVFFTLKPAYGTQVSNSQNGPHLLVYNQPKLSTHRDLLVADDLLELLQKNTGHLCLLDTAYFGSNYQQLYFEEHLKNSRHFDIRKALEKTPDGGEQLVHPLKFQAYARSLGLQKDCHVILYDHGETEDSILSATFAWWLFKVYSFERVSILNGGLGAWQRLAQRNPNLELAVVERGQPAPVVEGNFIAGWNAFWLSNYADTLEALKKNRTVFLDARPTGHFTGQDRDQLAAKAGRIRGAINIPTETLLTKQGAFKQLPELKQEMKNKRISGNRPIIVYSNDALQASALYFCTVQAGYSTKLFDGGWIEFSAKAPNYLIDLY